MRMCSLKSVLAVGFASLAFNSLAAGDYQDASLPTEQRVSNLLKQMTLQEKVAQLQTVWHEGRELKGPKGALKTDMAEKILPLGIGHIARPSEDLSPVESVKYTNAIQKWLIDNTRLSIPAIFHEEALHGHAASEATSFPQAIAMASTWDPQLIHDIYQASAEEVRARGGNQALTPILDVARDPRWGRIEETMGEDPYLIGELGVSAVKGFQGDEQNIPENRVMATLKHLAGHGQPTGGLNIAPAPIGERALREVFLFPFEAAVKLAHVGSVMASYNEIDGIPSHANKMLLTDILRDEWGFDGLLVSDYYAIKELITRHGLAGSSENAAIMALNAGVDVEMPDRDVFPLLEKLVNDEKVSMQKIDTAVARILREKFKLGLFENPYTDENAVDAIVGSQAHRDLAQVTAEKAMVLLKNDGVLPLDKTKVQSVAVIGPHADETLLGGYSDIPRQTVTILDGLRNKLGKNAKVEFSRGALITEDIQDPSPASVTAQSYSKERWNKENMKLADLSNAQALIDDAVALAKRSDVAVVVVGSNEGSSREAWAENHLGDRDSLNLLGEQHALVEAVLATGTPTVLILSNGRPLTLGNLYQDAPAIIEAWYLGQETGSAVANVLFGDVNPSGKLPLSLPKTVGQLPVFYNHKPSAKRGYIFGETAPAFAFGHGLSYTTFKYSDLSVDASNAKANGTVIASFTLTNNGDVDGEEVAQLYIRDVFSSVTRPVKELKGFKRVALKAGESKKVTFELPVNLLAFYDAQMRFVVEPGEIKLMIGSASDDIRLDESFEVVGDVSEIPQAQKAYLTNVSVQ
ncbi:Beta-glucosidase BoGH3B [Paraglaciecola mesophila]|uniref:beta-glucosidase n=1 Tax=Paraglaciecola mesophila TaxID=197222 RepID=A0A857JN40_9ALTE|nr:glycoside hydrolase family 3 N-terminal domain-containing protein [Paraglaciecola mesophila]QHJ12926.1 Beta-glucosidase BoGH3B [Paraglaciecola mesophila]